MKRMIMILSTMKKIDENKMKYGERIDDWLDGVMMVMIRNLITMMT